MTAVPVGVDRMADLQRLADLPARTRAELERFFLDATYFTEKNARVVGWKDEEPTRELVRQTQRAA